MSNDKLEKAFAFFDSQKPFSNGEMDRLGKSYRDGLEVDVERRDAIEAWFAQLSAHVVEVVYEALAQVLGADRISTRMLGVAARLKTKNTMVDKLKRGSNKLSAMQDFAGVRFDLDCSHEELIAIGEECHRLLDETSMEVKIKPILDEPHNGYRAVHLHFRSRLSGRVEVQLRTLLQTAWANAYERAGDIVGRTIRYDDDWQVEDPALAAVVTQLLVISENIYVLERNVSESYRNEEQAVARLHCLRANNAGFLPQDEVMLRGIAAAYDQCATMYRSMGRLARSNAALVGSLRELELGLRQYKSNMEGGK